MSDFMDAYYQMVKDTLCCPKCPAMNRPSVCIIDLSQNGTRAFCNQCAHSGPVEQFQQGKA